MARAAGVAPEAPMWLHRRQFDELEALPMRGDGRRRTPSAGWLLRRGSGGRSAAATV